MKCYAEKYCKKSKTECNEFCDGYRLLRALYKMSRIPERYCYNIPLVPETALTTLSSGMSSGMNSIVSTTVSGWSSTLSAFASAQSGISSYSSSIIGTLSSLAGSFSSAMGSISSSASSAAAAVNSAAASIQSAVKPPITLKVKRLRRSQRLCVMILRSLQDP